MTEPITPDQRAKFGRLWIKLSPTMPNGPSPEGEQGAWLMFKAILPELEKARHDSECLRLAVRQFEADIAKLKGLVPTPDALGNRPRCFPPAPA